MKTIFWGLLITCLHFNLNFDSSTIDLIPSFLGWYLVSRGLCELPPCTARDDSASPVKLMIALTAATWFLQILGGLGIFGGAVALLSGFCEFYALWMLIQTVKAMELIVSHSMPGETLSVVWRAYLLCTILVYVPFLSGICALVALGCKIALVYWFWRAAKAYEEAMAHPIEILPPEE